MILKVFITFNREFEKSMFIKNTFFDIKNEKLSKYLCLQEKQNEIIILYFISS